MKNFRAYPRLRGPFTSMYTLKAKVNGKQGNISPNRMTVGKVWFKIHVVIVSSGQRVNGRAESPPFVVINRPWS